MPPSTSVHDIKTLISSFHPLLVIETSEEDRVHTILDRAAQELRMVLFDWSITRGLRRKDPKSGREGKLTGGESPLGLLKHIETLAVEGIYLLKDFEAHLENPPVARQLREVAQQFTRKRSILVLTGQTLSLPEDLRDLAVYYELEFPKEEELRLVDAVATPEFQTWALETFRTLVGLSRQDAARLLDWGEDTGRPVWVPRRRAELQAPRLGISDDGPWLPFDDDRLHARAAEAGRLFFDFDVITAMGWLISGYEEYLEQERDRFGRWCESNSLVSAHGFSRAPAVNVWVKRIRDFLRDQNCDIVPLWPDGKRYAVALSHDIDNPYYAVAPHLGHLFRSVMRRDPRGLRHSAMKAAGAGAILAADRFRAPRGFTSLLNLEARLGVSSTIFVSGLTPGAPYAQPNDPIYSVSEEPLVKSLERARDLGCAIGLHPAVATAPHTDRYGDQKQFVERVLGHSIRIVRHHYYNISREETADALEAMAQTGFEFDSSLTFYDSPNFRRSIAWPFTPFHPRLDRPIPITELPPTFMDGWLDASDPEASLWAHIEDVGRLEGMVVLNWHGNRFNNRRYLGQGRVYGAVVAELTRRSDVWLTSLESVGDWWKVREQRLRR